MATLPPPPSSGAAATPDMNTTLDMDPTLDLAALIDMFGDDRDKVAKLLLRFIDSTRAGFAEMQASLASGDVARMRELGHRIKSASRIVGAGAMAALCERLEKLPPADAASEQADAAALLAHLWPLLEQASLQIDLYLHPPVPSPPT